MGSQKIITKEQEIILDKVAGDDYLATQFYFTGGTALSLIYLQHRESVDLDFFSDTEFDPQAIIQRLDGWASELKFTYTPSFIDPVYFYALKFEDGANLKIDFAAYPYTQLSDRQLYKGKLKVDSKFDISVNKFLTVSQRNEVKDFVDLYYLMKEYSFWDLKFGLEKKFKQEVDVYTKASDLLEVETFENMPKMNTDLKLEGLKSFFRDLAKGLGKGSVE